MWNSSSHTLQTSCSGSWTFSVILGPLWPVGNMTCPSLEQVARGHELVLDAARLPLRRPPLSHPELAAAPSSVLV